MFIELLWIESKIRQWLIVAKDRPVTPDVTPAEVRAALLTLHEHAPSSIGRYRREYSNFEELYPIAGLQFRDGKVGPISGFRSPEVLQPAPRGAHGFTEPRVR